MTVSPYVPRQGVVGAIGAWNYPIQISAWKSAAAMAAGNTVVFKPSELTPTTAVMVAEMYAPLARSEPLFEPRGRSLAVSNAVGLAYLRCRRS
jgi:hypothetical protein